jgi:hypothetical protein
MKKIKAIMQLKRDQQRATKGGPVKGSHPRLWIKPKKDTPEEDQKKKSNKRETTIKISFLSSRSKSRVL